MEILDKQVDSLFADIRIAHRLIYEYQKRVLDLVFYIKGKLNFPDRVGGYKRFSNAIGKTRTYSNDYPEANLFIDNTMWAWDFLYSYIMEFYFGEVEIRKHTFCTMSIIEISDTGYYSSRQQDRNQQDIQTFANIEDSNTMLIFVFETANKKYKLWDTSDEKIREWILSTKTCLEKKNDDDIFLIMKVPMHRLINKEKIDIVISEFNDFVKETTGIGLIE